MSDTTPISNEAIVDQVRERYGRIARTKEAEAADTPCSCCGSSEVPIPETSTVLGYERDDLSAVPAEADLGLGCGAPIAHLALQPGETVLDLGSGGGLDAFLAARRVGPEGRVYGVDMTPDMIERARRNAEKGGYSNVEFRLGRLESLPIDDSSIDAITSNCVINLVPDKAAVFREVVRVLRPGGRLVVSDIVLDRDLPEAVAKSVTAYAGCVAGALRQERYFEIVHTAGLTDVEILRDIDFLASVTDDGASLPPDLQEILEGSGVRLEDLRGAVRSVTFRAFRPRA